MKFSTLPISIKVLLLLYICSSLACSFLLSGSPFDRIRWNLFPPFTEVATGQRHHEAKLNSTLEGFGRCYKSSIWEVFSASNRPSSWCCEKLEVKANSFFPSLSSQDHFYWKWVSRCLELLYHRTSGASKLGPIRAVIVSIVLICVLISSSALFKLIGALLVQSFGQAGCLYPGSSVNLFLNFPI